MGLFLVRGDSIIILGEIDIEKERALEINKVEPEVMAELLSKSQSEKDEWDFDWNLIYFYFYLYFFLMKNYKVVN